MARINALMTVVFQLPNHFRVATNSFCCAPIGLAWAKWRLAHLQYGIQKVIINDDQSCSDLSCFHQVQVAFQSSPRQIQIPYMRTARRRHPPQNRTGVLTIYIPVGCIGYVVRTAFEVRLGDKYGSNTEVPIPQLLEGGAP